MDRGRHAIGQAHAGAKEEGRAAIFLEVRLELRGQGVSADEAWAKGLGPLFNGNISDKNPPNRSFLVRSSCKSEVYRLHLRDEKRKVPQSFSFLR